MPAIETSIWLALRARLEGLVLSPALPILWPGENETLPAGNCLEVTHFPNRPDRPMVGSDASQIMQGFLQVAVLTIPGAPHHETVAREIAGTVADHFATDLRLTHGDVTLRITRRPDIARGLRNAERARWLTPISVYYEAFV